MAIQKLEMHWVGSSEADICPYLEDYTSWLDPIDISQPAACACGSRVFRLSADAGQGSAQRQCAACGAVQFIAGSEAYWREAEPQPVCCPECGSANLNLGLGFALHRDGEVSWVYVGTRCVSCGTLACPVDWANETFPSSHLLEAP